MADSVRITNLPESGSPARVAYDLTLHLSHLLPNATGEERIKAVLDLYADCHYAALGHRNQTRR